MPLMRRSRERINVSGSKTVITFFPCVADGRRTGIVAVGVKTRSVSALKKVLTVRRGGSVGRSHFPFAVLSLSKCMYILFFFERSTRSAPCHGESACSRMRTSSSFGRTENLEEVVAPAGMQSFSDAGNGSVVEATILRMSTEVFAVRGLDGDLAAELAL
jgi:hypothetical protein